MGVVSPAAFERLLARLSQDEFVTFVSDLWVARGLATTVDGEIIIVDSTDTGHDSVRIRVSHQPTAPGVYVPLPVGPSIDPEGLTDVDVLVTNVESDQLREIAESTDTGYVGPERLRELLLYAIDRDTSRELFQRHFDRPVDLSRKTETKTHRAWNPIAGRDWLARVRHRGTDDDQGSWTVRVAIVLTAVMLILGGITAVGTSTGLAVLNPGSNSVGTKSPAAEPGRSLADLPPGISPSGLENASALVRAHRTALTNRTYRLVIRHRGTRGLVVTTARWRRSNQIIRKTATARYHYSVDGVLPPPAVGGTTRPIRFELSVDGPDCTSRIHEFETYGPDEQPCTLVASENGISFARITSQYLARYLDGDESRVRSYRRNDRTWYRVIVTGTPKDFFVPATNYTAVALVGESGIVYEFSVRYETETAARPGPVSFSFRFENVSTAVPNAPGTWCGSRTRHPLPAGNSTVGHSNSIGVRGSWWTHSSIPWTGAGCFSGKLRDPTRNFPGPFGRYGLFPSGQPALQFPTGIPAKQDLVACRYQKQVQ